MAAINPNNDKNKPTGSLEELFRHHLAEAELPPRPMLWDQIDNSLLTAQNETYRRRLAATRWVAAASLLLATLAGTGWWLQHDAISPNQLAVNRLETANTQRQTSATTSAENTTSYGAVADVAAATSPTITITDKPGTASNTFNSHSKASLASATTQSLSATSLVSTPSATPLVSILADTRQTPATSNQLAASSAAARSGAPVASSAAGLAGIASARSLGSSAARPGLGQAATTGLGNSSPTTYAANNRTAGSVGLASSASAAATESANQAGQIGSTAESASAVASAGEQLDWLAMRPVALAYVPMAVPQPNGLAAVPVATAAIIPPARKWQFGLNYTASAFNPNVNFSRVGSAADFDYNPALGPNSPALSEAAASEYRHHLQSGLGQRLALRATRRLGGHWAFSTGLELAQNTAKSATSYVFLGEQVPDFGTTTGSSDLRGTTFRYRTAGIPLELRYTNPGKKGWSSYARLGAVVSALFSVRAEVDGYPEAARAYSLRSGSDAYRKVMTNMRGGAGAQFRPETGNWAFTLGPTAEVGLLSLNAHPAQDFLHQSRAYSFGLEAGMEFGRK